MTTTTTLAERIARSIPGGTFELETFVRLVGVEETTAVETAAVTCHGRSRLRINPDFVAQYCRRDEHLFLLVMHELWHVLLGHTTAFEQVTPEHNIAFDAVINAGLGRAHPQPEYRGFFEELNPPDVFPNLLLRPPIGWPNQPDYEVPGPRWTRSVLRRLYPRPGFQLPEATYVELLDLIRQDRPDSEAGQVGRPVLLGDYSGEAHAPDRAQDPLLGDVLREVTRSWPGPDGIRGADGQRTERWIDAVPVADAARAAFRAVLQGALQPDRGGASQRRRVLTSQPSGRAPIPTATDRLVPARRALGVPALLYEQHLPAPATVTDPPQAALVYLDVSGSMGTVLPHLLDLLVPLARRRLVRVQQFSTEVHPLSIEDLAAGRLRTTGGTAIDCVLADAAQWPHRRVLLLTDGYVGAAPRQLLQPLLGRGVRFFAAIPETGSTSSDLPFAHVTVLPRLAS